MRGVLQLSTVVSAVATGIFLLIHSQYPKRNKADKPQQPPPSPDEKQLWRKMLVWSGFLTMTAFSMNIARPYVATFLAKQVNLSDFYVGMFGSVVYAGITFIGIFAGRLGDRWRKSGAISLCLVLYPLSIVPLLMIREPAALMLVAFLYGGSAVSGNLVSAYVGTISPETKRGVWMSIPQSLSLLAAFAAPYLGGYLYTQSPSYALIVSAIAIPFLALMALTKLKE
jgi:MFS family permease